MTTISDCRMCGEPIPFAPITVDGHTYCDQTCAAGAGKAPMPSDPEPLTRERARAWIRAEFARLDELPWGSEALTGAPTYRMHLFRLVLNTALPWGLDALADLLVDAAAGRIR